MAPDKSTGSGRKENAAGAGSTAAKPKTSRPKGSRSTGGGSKARQPRMSLADTLAITQSSIGLLAEHFGQIAVTNGQGPEIHLTLPAGLHCCIAPGCVSFFGAPVPDSLYCVKHRPVTVQEDGDGVQHLQAGQPDPAGAPAQETKPAQPEQADTAQVGAAV